GWWDGKGVMERGSGVWVDGGEREGLVGGMEGELGEEVVVRGKGGVWGEKGEVGKVGGRNLGGRGVMLVGEVLGGRRKKDW
ncbi:hypothetical protein MU719_29215, partial [Pseudomonas aeruginosa]|uniref:hypothetical protein n=1 Tax=Pseudomonas aeruginosa TaxID=287 RepID=UPI0024BEB799